MLLEQSLLLNTTSLFRGVLIAMGKYINKNLSNIFAKRFCISLTISFMTGWVFVTTNSIPLAIPFATILYTLFSILGMQIFLSFIEKFLKKELEFNELSYIRQTFSIVTWDLICSIILPLVAFLATLSKDVISFEETQLEHWVWERLIKNPFYWIHFCGILVFSYRVKILKDKLLRLQALFKG